MPACPCVVVRHLASRAFPGVVAMRLLSRAAACGAVVTHRGNRDGPCGEGRHLGSHGARALVAMRHHRRLLLHLLLRPSQSRLLSCCRTAPPAAEARAWCVRVRGDGVSAGRALDDAGACQPGQVHSASMIAGAAGRSSSGWEQFYASPLSAAVAAVCLLLCLLLRLLLCLRKPTFCSCFW
jgi:hypothetical protein